MIIEDNGSLNMADTLLVVDDVELNRGHSCRNISGFLSD